jgi:hypothetical protein
LGGVLCRRHHASLERVLAIRLGWLGVRIDGNQHVDEHWYDDDRSWRNDHRVWSSGCGRIDQRDDGDGRGGRFGQRDDDHQRGCFGSRRLGSRRFGNRCRG